uniref:Uncharacterized protein n=1 Tax=Aegilops tauschii subsp. strangulata TaxID=200361 RepID=A0A453KPW6_AEGTS
KETRREKPMDRIPQIPIEIEKARILPVPFPLRSPPETENRNKIVVKDERRERTDQQRKSSEARRGAVSRPASQEGADKQRKRPPDPLPAVSAPRFPPSPFIRGTFTC